MRSAIKVTDQKYSRWNQPIKMIPDKPEAQPFELESQKPSPFPMSYPCVKSGNSAYYLNSILPNSNQCNHRPFDEFDFRPSLKMKAGAGFSDWHY